MIPETKVKTRGTCTFSAFLPGVFTVDADSVLGEAILLFSDTVCFSMARYCVGAVETCLFELLFCMKCDGGRF